MLIAAHIGFTGFRQLSTQFEAQALSNCIPDSCLSMSEPVAAVGRLSHNGL